MFACVKEEQKWRLRNTDLLVGKSSPLSARSKRRAKVEVEKDKCGSVASDAEILAKPITHATCACICMCACVRVCVHVCVRACVCARVLIRELGVPRIHNTYVIDNYTLTYPKGMCHQVKYQCTFESILDIWRVWN